jgi:hypothetical protein
VQGVVVEPLRPERLQGALRGAVDQARLDPVAGRESERAEQDGDDDEVGKSGHGQRFLVFLGDASASPARPAFVRRIWE